VAAQSLPILVYGLLLLGFALLQAPLALAADWGRVTAYSEVILPAGRSLSALSAVLRSEPEVLVLYRKRADYAKLRNSRYSARRAFDTAT
jgi:hypothetical protein